jgi:hypothetical protein
VDEQRGRESRERLRAFAAAVVQLRDADVEQQPQKSADLLAVPTVDRRLGLLVFCSIEIAERPSIRFDVGSICRELTGAERLDA